MSKVLMFQLFFIILWVVSIPTAYFLNNLVFHKPIEYVYGAVALNTFIIIIESLLVSVGLILSDMRKQK